MQEPAESKPREEQESSLIRVEANLEELPVFSATKRARREEVVHWSREGRDPVTHRPVQQRVTLRPAVGLGLPAERERDVYYLVIAAWLEEHGFGDEGRIGPIRYQDACTMLGWKRSGRSYELLRDALRTLVSLQVEFENAILDGKTRKLLERGGGLFSEYAMYGETTLDAPLRVQRGVFSLKASPWFQSNWEANYRKPFDRAIYTALRMPLAKWLYPYLDKRAWRRGGYADQVIEDLNGLRERARLGVRRTDHLLEEFRRAHDDLRRCWPLLQDARIEKITAGRYRVVYVFSPQVSLPFEAEEAPAAPVVSAGEGSVLVPELRRRGMNQGTAEELVRQYDSERIRRHLDIHDQELKQRPAGEIENPAGWLYKRIKNDWDPFEGYRSPEDRQRARRSQDEAAAKQRADREADEAERLRFASLTPEQKATERLERYAMIQNIRRPLTPEQRERKYQELLAEYRLQEESKIS